MTRLRQRMLEDMQLRGLSARTQGCYVGAVRQLAEHYHRSPDQVSEEEPRQYFLFLANEKKVAPPRRSRPAGFGSSSRTRFSATGRRCASSVLVVKRNCQWS